MNDKLEPLYYYINRKKELSNYVGEILFSYQSINQKINDKIPLIGTQKLDNIASREYFNKLLYNIRKDKHITYQEQGLIINALKYLKDKRNEIAHIDESKIRLLELENIKDTYDKIIEVNTCNINKLINLYKEFIQKNPDKNLCFKLIIKDEFIKEKYGTCEYDIKKFQKKINEEIIELKKKYPKYAQDEDFFYKNYDLIEKISKNDENFEDINKLSSSINYDIHKDTINATFKYLNNDYYTILNNNKCLEFVKNVKNLESIINEKVLLEVKYNHEFAKKWINKIFYIIKNNYESSKIHKKIISK